MNTFKTNIKLLYLSLAITLFASSCSDDNEVDSNLPASLEGAVFVTNEGGFGNTDGTISIIKGNTAYVDVITDLGDVVQSSWIDGSQFFAVVNNSNKIEVFDLSQKLKLSYTVSSLSLPRYVTTSGTQGYVTEWVSFTEAGQLTIFETETGTIKKSITTDFGAERVLIAGNRIFVSNNFTNTISVIGLESEELIGNIEVGNGPAGLVTDAEGDVWVLCTGGYDLDYNPLGDGKLVELTTSSEIKKEIALGQNVKSELQISPEGTDLFYYNGTSIYKVSTSATVAPPSAYIQEENATSFYGLGVGKDGKIYAGDAKDFNQNGFVFIYNADGTTATNAGFSVGRNPNGFSFN